jgi:ParB family transcriptional regulator, chromosome partitioning protein
MPRKPRTGVAQFIDLNTDNQIEYIPINAIVPFSLQPRQYFDSAELQGLADSIAEQGIIEPPIVRPSSEPNTYELIIGERRWRASQMAGLESIPVIVKKIDDKAALRLNLTEQLHHQNLNPLEEAKGFLDLLALELGIKADAVTTLLYKLNRNEYKSDDNVIIAQKEAVEGVFSNFSKITWQSFVRNRLSLFSLPEPIKTAIQEGKLDYTKAIAIAKLKKLPKKMAALLKLVIAEDLSLSEIRERVKKELQSFEKADNPSAERHQKVSDRLKTVYHKIKNSKIEEPEQLERIEKLISELEEFLS